MAEDLAMLLVELEREEVPLEVQRRLDAGEDPVRILNECRKGMAIVGDRFQSGEYYLAHMMLAADTFKGAVNILEPHLAKSRPEQPRGKVVLATLRGDIHDLGKNILTTLLRAQGFEVRDLGVDVKPEKVVEAVKEMRPGFLGFSALITSSFAQMKQTTDMLQEAGLREGLKVMVGGGVTTDLTREYIGADFQTLDAMQGVAYCMEHTAELQPALGGR
jgi:methylmalonyl-CoA mutase cobalamin-binding domain/chain